MTENRFPACMRHGPLPPRGSLGIMGRQLAGAWLGLGPDRIWVPHLWSGGIEVAWDGPDDSLMIAAWDPKRGRRGALLRVEGRKVANWMRCAADANLEGAVREALEQDEDCATRLVCIDERGPAEAIMWGLPPWLMTSAVVAGAFVERVAPDWHVPADIPEVAVISRMFCTAAVARGGVDHWPFLESAVSIHPLGLEGMIWARLEWDRALIWADFLEEDGTGLPTAEYVRSLHAFADLPGRAAAATFYVIDHRADGLLYPIGIPQDPSRHDPPAPRPIVIHGAPEDEIGIVIHGAPIIKGNACKLDIAPASPPPP